MRSDAFLPPRVVPKQSLAAASRRVRSSFWAATQASLAAALAWFVAHSELGHPQPFFAPIAAAIALSTGYFGRTRRAIQMVVGVLLGIAIAELLTKAFGTSTIAIGATVLATMLVALFVGGGFFGEGMMFINQAAASAILVITLRHHGTGAERAVDALVGGGAALLVGVIMFPSHPLPRLWGAERALVDSLANALEQVSKLLERGLPPAGDWTLTAGYDIHRRLADLAQARAAARENVRVAPRRWKLRPQVAAEDRRIARFDLLANAVLSLVRATVATLEDDSLPTSLKRQVAALATGLRRLTRVPQPWPADVLQSVASIAGRAIGNAPEGRVDPVPTVSAILRATARDLLSVTEQEW